MPTRERIQLTNFDKTKTKQSFADKVNINKIVAKHQRSGMVEHLNEKEPFYGDVTHLGDYRESLNIVIEAKELFAKMSAEIREKFKNNPNEMITFLNNPANLAEAVALKMVKPRPPVPGPVPSEPTKPLAPAPTVPKP